MTIQIALEKAYDLLPNGAKRKAARIYDTSTQYFKNIVNGDVKNEEAYKNAMTAVKKAALEEKISIEKTLEEIEKLENQIS